MTEKKESPFNKISHRLFLEENGKVPILDNAAILDEEMTVLGFITTYPLSPTNAKLYRFRAVVTDRDGNEMDAVFEADSLEVAEDEIRETLQQMSAMNDKDMITFSESEFEYILDGHHIVLPGVYKLKDKDGTEVGRVEINTKGKAGGGLSDDHVITLIIGGAVGQFNFHGHDVQALNAKIEEVGIALI